MYSLLIAVVMLVSDPGGFRIIHEKLDTGFSTFKVIHEKLPETPQPPALPENVSPEPVKQQLIFWASWCGACPKPDGDVVKALKGSNWVVSDSATAQVRLVDIDANPSLAQQYEITAIPTYVLLVDGKVVSKHTGQLSAIDIANQYYRQGRFAAPKAIIDQPRGSAVSVRYVIQWPGMTEDSLRKHLAEAPHSLDTTGWTYQQMINWHDDWHAKHPETEAPRQTRRRNRRG